MISDLETHKYLLSLTGRMKYILAADIGGTNTRIAIMQLGSKIRIVSKSVLKTRYIKSMHTLINGFIDHTDNRGYRIKEAFIGAKGSVSPSGDSIILNKWIKINRNNLLRKTHLKKIF